MEIASRFLICRKSLGELLMVEIRVSFSLTQNYTHSHPFVLLGMPAVDSGRNSNS